MIFFKFFVLINDFIGYDFHASSTPIGKFDINVIYTFFLEEKFAQISRMSSFRDQI